MPTVPQMAFGVVLAIAAGVIITYPLMPLAWRYIPGATRAIAG